MPKTTQLVRQWLLLRGLSARPEGATVGDLAAENGVCEKTIRRDLLALARIGFPLQEQTGPHGLKHWQLAAADGVPPVHFGFVETASLYLGRQLLQPLAPLMQQSSFQHFQWSCRLLHSMSMYPMLHQPQQRYCQLMQPDL